MTDRAATGRPLRFFGALLFMWVAARVVFHLIPMPEAILERTAGIVPRSQAALLTRAVDPPSVAPIIPLPHLMRAVTRTGRTASSIITPKSDDSVTIDLLAFIRFSVSYANRRLADEALAQDEPGTRPAPPTPIPIPIPIPAAIPFTPPSASAAANRWQLSLWSLWRPHGARGRSAASAGQLGGSQAGVRLDLDLTPGTPHRLAAYARATTALGHPAAPEAALGLAYQPARRLPVTLALERRIALGKGARNATAVMAVGGFGPTPLTPGLLAEGYGQAGIVGLRSGDRFADGKLSLLTPIDRLPVSLGASLSGGVQPAVHRVDVGPEVQLRLPLPSAPARLSLEWRQRIAGLARPASGLAITLAADF